VDDPHDLAVEELNARQVDGHDDVRPEIPPYPGLRARLAHDPLADRDDQADLLGQGDELRGRDEAALGMSPSDQRLGADEPAVRHVHLRLVVQLELVSLERLSKRRLEGQAMERDPAHRPFVELVAVAARPLGLVHGHVRVLQERLDLLAVLG
jgi:hypothetical protein